MTEGDDSGDDIVSNDPPNQGLWQPSTSSRKPPHKDSVRWWLSLGMLILLLVAIGVGAAGYLQHDDVGEWSTFCAPLFTLAGVALTFYFTHPDKRDRS